MSYTASYIVNSSSAQGTTDFQFTFPYIKEEHIEVYLNYSKITQGSGSAQYQVITNVSPKLIRLNTGIASANLRVEVRRNSSLGSPLVDYADGSTLTANDLDTSALQSLYIDQELKDNQSKTVSVNETTGLPTLNNQRLTNVADPTAAQDAATKNYIDTKQFTSSQIQDGTLVNADVNASAAIAGTKISPNFGSQNIVTSGTVDGRDVSNDGIKLDSIETGATADQTNAEIRAAVEAASDSNVFTDADHTKLNAIEPSATADQTDAEIRAAVESATDSNVFTDADHSKLNAIEPGATADQTNAEIRAAVEAATDSNVFTDADHSKLNAIEPSATADQTASEIKTLLQSDKLTNSEIATGALDGRYYTETESDARYFNISTGDTIKDGDTFPDNDTTIATTAAINDRIIDLVDDVGGFVPIANETSFPNANPDVNNGAGTLVSIKALSSNLTSNGSGVATISNGTVGNSTVTITGLANSTTYAANFGLIVETTSTLNTYAFHRQVPIATEVSTVAGSISNVNTVAGSISNVNTVAGNNSNISTVAGVSGNVTTVAGVASNVTTVAGISSDVTAVAADATDIGAVAAKATEIGRLGTADAVADLNTLGTTAIVSDLDTCATNVSNINTAAGSISNINTVATNISDVNDFSDKYRVASSAPTSNNDAGDLYFDTSSNELRVYNGSAWQGGVTATGNLAGLGANTFTGNQSLGDNIKVIFGTGGDLEIFHNATNSEIKNATGTLYLESDNTWFTDKEGSDVYAKFQHDGAVELYYDNSLKFRTHSAGSVVYGHLYSDDNNKIQLGTSQDLQIYHDGTDSWVKNWTGKLNLTATSSESGIIINPNGAVELFYNNTWRFKTENWGVSVNGNLALGDSEYLNFGANNDLQIYHDGSNSYLVNTTGELQLRDESRIRLRTDQFVLNNHANDESIIYAAANGATELYYDGSKKFQTNGAGVDVFENLYLGDNVNLKFGTSADLQIYHDGNNSFIKDTGTGRLSIVTSELQLTNAADSEVMIKATENGAVELYYDGVKKLETTANGATLTGTLYASDAVYVGDTSDSGSTDYIAVGTGKDLKLYHDGSHSNVQNTTGNLHLRSSANCYIQVGDGSGGWENALRSYPSGAVELRYDDVKKFETTSDGATVSGHLKSYHLKPLADDTYDVGTSALRWRDGFFHDGVDLPDNGKLKLGDGDDLQIYYTGSAGWIYQSESGNDVTLGANAGNVWLRTGASANDDAIKCVSDGAVELYHDGSKKLETTSGGVNVIGALTVGGAAVGGGVWERISSYDVSGTPNAINFSWGTSSSILTDYEKIRVELYNLKSSTYSWVYLEFLNSSGNAITGNNYQWVGITAKHGNNDWGRYGNGWTADTKVKLMQEAGRSVSGHIDIADPFDNTTSDGPILFQWSVVSSNKTVYDTSDGNLWSHTGHALFGEDVAWDTKIYGVQLYNATSTTNFTDGRMVLYGLKAS